VSKTFRNVYEVRAKMINKIFCLSPEDISHRLGNGST